MNFKLLKQDKQKLRLSQVIFSKQGVGRDFQCSFKALKIKCKKILCKLKINNFFLIPHTSYSPKGGSTRTRDCRIWRAP